MNATARRRRKKAANLSMDEALLERVRRMKLNLSQVFEASLTEAVRRGERTEKHGVFSDGLRSFWERSSTSDSSFKKSPLSP